ncbi:MAG: NADH:flavin oxidoreductase [Actinomycetia bacterium]|nr:NADH:flavin oxidoreductase [Actinomycetes bacterium]
MSRLFEPTVFPRGSAMANRFMLAALTNTQSYAEGTLSADEHNWLTMRARGGFGAVMTAAAHVQPCGQGFPGQLGIFADRHVTNLTNLASALRVAGTIPLVQLHHAGNRAPADIIDATPVSASDDPETGARGLPTPEVEELIESFVAAAERAERAGFAGVELHGAHGYVLCQFLSAELNNRDDRFGGDLEGRSRIFFDILDGIRSRCGDDFIVGVRLSPERFGMKLAEIRTLSQRLIDSGQVDFLDLSLWDCFKEPVEEEWAGRSLCEVATDLDRRHDPSGRRVPLGVAGKIHDPADAERVLDMGADFAILGRVAILHHDYPRRLAADPEFVANRPPVSPEYLAAEGLSPAFVEYLSRPGGLVKTDHME